MPCSNSCSHHFSFCNDTRCGNEQEALQLARRMRRVPVTLPSSIAKHPVETNYVRVEPVTGDVGGPILLLHGFDSSLLEWRRLIPELENMGADAYAMDVLGWGFTGSEVVTSFGAGEVCRGCFMRRRYPKYAPAYYLRLTGEFSLHCVSL